MCVCVCVHTYILYLSFFLYCLKCLTIYLQLKYSICSPLVYRAILVPLPETYPCSPSSGCIFKRAYISGHSYICHNLLLTNIFQLTSISQSTNS